MSTIRKSLATALAVVVMSSAGMSMTTTGAEAHHKKFYKKIVKHKYKPHGGYCGWKVVWKKTHPYHAHKHKVKFWSC